MAAYFFDAWKDSCEVPKPVVRERPVEQVQVVSPDQPPEHFDLDLRGLHCPVPVLRTQSKMARMRPGDTIRVLASDPSSWKDFPAFAARKKYDLFKMDDSAQQFEYWLKKT